jgi:hypothetical protein
LIRHSTGTVDEVDRTYDSQAKDDNQGACARIRRLAAEEFTEALADRPINGR